MRLFHSVSNGLEDEEDDDDCANEVRPNIDRLIVDHEQGFNHLFRRIIAHSVSLSDVLIVLHVFGDLLEPSHVLSRRVRRRMSPRLLLLLSHLLIIKYTKFSLRIIVKSLYRIILIEDL